MKTIFESLFDCVSRFRASSNGSFALKTALLMPILLGLAGAGIDFTAFNQQKANLQNAADAAALASVREAGLKGWTEEVADAVAQAVLDANLKTEVSGSTRYTADANVDVTNRRVKVVITQDHFPYFAASIFPSPQISVSATATAAGSSSACVIVSANDGSKAFDMTGDAFVRANDCVAYSNSEDKQGLSVMDNARLVSEMTCSAGGTVGLDYNYKPSPITDCPSIADPLISRRSLMDEAVAGLVCDHNEKQELINAKGSIFPGVYCAELKIKDKSKITLEPGIYVFKNAKFKVEKGSQIFGEDVTLVFLEQKGELEFKNDSEIDLSATKGGPFAGILVYAQYAEELPARGRGKGRGKPRKFKIESKKAKQLVGAFYLPSDTLTIGGDKDADGICDPDFLGAPPEGKDCDTEVGDVSAWTAIVAKNLVVTNGARLIINADYASSDVPVPDGIGSNASSIRLIK